jgi:hypothetical protein
LAVEGKKKIKVGGRPASVNRERGNIPLVCRIEGDGERLLWEKRKNQKGLFCFFLAGLWEKEGK